MVHPLRDRASLTRLVVPVLAVLGLYLLTDDPVFLLLVVGLAVIEVVDSLSSRDGLFLTGSALLAVGAGVAGLASGSTTVLAIGAILVGLLGGVVGVRQLRRPTGE
jgi:hypothetical protein